MMFFFPKLKSKEKNYYGGIFFTFGVKVFSPDLIFKKLTFNILKITFEV